MLKITILGSGTFTPIPHRHTSSHLFQTERENVIFDFGRGAIDSLLEKKLSLYDIDTIFLSHFHSDHISDLCAYLGWATVKFRFENIGKKVRIYGPKGIKRAMKHLRKATSVYGDYKKIKNILEIIELKENQIVKTKNLSVEGFKVPHSGEFNSFSYRMRYKNKVICYSGDSPDCQGLRNASKDADLAIMECSLPRKAGVESHISGDELGRLAHEERIKKMVLVHIDVKYRLVVKKEIEKEYSGKVILAKDMDKFII